MSKIIKTLSISNDQLTFGDNLKLNKGLAYEIINATSEELSIKIDHELVSENIIHSDGSTGADANGKSSGSITFVLPSNASTLTFQYGNKQILADIRGPYTGDLSSLSQVSILDGIIFNNTTSDVQILRHKDTFDTDTGTFFEFTFNLTDEYMNAVETLTKEAAAIWNDIIDFSIFAETLQAFGRTTKIPVDINFTTDSENGDLEGKIANASVRLSMTLPISSEQTTTYVPYYENQDRDLSTFLTQTDTSSNIPGVMLPVESTILINPLDLIPTGYDADTSRNIMFRELGKILGIGLFWNSYDQNDHPGENPTVFKGHTATQEYNRIGGARATGIPLDTTGLYFNPTILAGEITTPDANKQSALSRLTINALSDMGYKIKDTAINYIDNYVLPTIQPEVVAESVSEN
jgi:hypothetical protein